MWLVSSSWIRKTIATKEWHSILQTRRESARIVESWSDSSVRRPCVPASATEIDAEPIPTKYGLDGRSGVGVSTNRHPPMDDAVALHGLTDRRRERRRRIDEGMSTFRTRLKSQDIHPGWMTLLDCMHRTTGAVGRLARTYRGMTLLHCTDGPTGGERRRRRRPMGVGVKVSRRPPGLDDAAARTQGRWTEGAGMDAEDHRTIDDESLCTSTSPSSHLRHRLRSARTDAPLHFAGGVRGGGWRGACRARGDDDDAGEGVCLPGVAVSSDGRVIHERRAAGGGRGRGRESRGVRGPRVGGGWAGMRRARVSRRETDGGALVDVEWRGSKWPLQRPAHVAEPRVSRLGRVIPTHGRRAAGGGRGRESRGVRGRRGRRWGCALTPGALTEGMGGRASGVVVSKKAANPRHWARVGLGAVGPEAAVVDGRTRGASDCLSGGMSVFLAAIGPHSSGVQCVAGRRSSGASVFLADTDAESGESARLGMG
ncbi:hypothetical protein B0H13DRAFT_1893872 [Mycena leptocephala]|nr:hypothetical protein B0H13DRAFT_1893872 [Mycena leptocephala]